jgi:uncharacterized membrane protein YdjX (TVP38/TMEM64 family)
VLAALAVLLFAQQLGVFRQFADPAGVKQALVQLGPWGLAAFVTAYASLQPFGFPAMVFTLSAPLIWPWPLAFAASLTGAMAASIVGFVFARFVARDWVSARLPDRFRRHDEALARRGLATVFVLRSLFWMSSPLHACLGVSQVRFSTHLWGSLAAYVPPLLLISLFGEPLFAYLRAAPPALWIALALATTTLALVIWILRRRHSAKPAPTRGAGAHGRDEP